MMGSTPHRAAPRRTAPHRTAQHRTAPHRTALHRTGPGRDAPHQWQERAEEETQDCNEQATPAHDQEKDHPRHDLLILSLAAAALITAIR
jgi:hypothetical protein